MNNNDPQNSEIAEWRSLLSPQELAAFEAGKYDNVRTAPKEPSRISRREISFNPEFDEHQPSHDPQLKAYHQQILEAIDGFADVTANCEACGHFFKGGFKEPRVTVLRHSGENENQAEVFCIECYGKSAPRASWRDGLTKMHLRVWDMFADEITQKDIAEKLSAEGNPISQSTVSRLIKEVRAAQKATR